MEMQEIIDKAVDAYLEIEPKEVHLPKDLREALDAAAALYERRDKSPYDFQWRMVSYILSATRKQLGLK